MYCKQTNTLLHYTSVTSKSQLKTGNDSIKFRILNFTHYVYILTEHYAVFAFVAVYVPVQINIASYTLGNWLTCFSIFLGHLAANFHLSFTGK